MTTSELNNNQETILNTISEEKLPEEPLSAYTGMNEVFSHTRKIVDGMIQGEKITVKDLVDKVTAQVRLQNHKMSTGHVTNLVQIFLKQCKAVSVEIGRGGGVFKGGKPKRIDNRPRCTTCNQVIRPDSHKHIQTQGQEEDVESLEQ